ncbi:hypothetical protein, partial [Bosea sp. (in: a-proteobacteria)]|uniref:hypothetical protein n=1 Tax=Bosea sp. (in: a-proteobacteria) TaxID=1871050 RepID=UPI0040345F9E
MLPMMTPQLLLLLLPSTHHNAHEQSNDGVALKAQDVLQLANRAGAQQDLANGFSQPPKHGQAASKHLTPPAAQHSIMISVQPMPCQAGGYQQAGRH